VRYEVECLYSKDLTVSTQVEREGVKTVNVSGSGEFDVQMQACLDRECDERLYEPPMVIPRWSEELVVEVFTSYKTGFALNLKHCWASGEAGDPQAVILIKDYCERPAEIEVEFVKQERELTRMALPLFRLGDSPFIFLYCNVHLCAREEGCFTCDKKGNIVDENEDKEKPIDPSPPDKGPIQGPGGITFGQGPFVIDTETVQIDLLSPRLVPIRDLNNLLRVLTLFMALFVGFVSSFLFSKYYKHMEGRDPDKWIFLYHRMFEKETLVAQPVRSLSLRTGASSETDPLYAMGIRKPDTTQKVDDITPSVSASTFGPQTTTGGFVHRPEPLSATLLQPAASAADAETERDEAEDSYSPIGLPVRLPTFGTVLPALRASQGQGHQQSQRSQGSSGGPPPQAAMTAPQLMSGIGGGGGGDGDGNERRFTLTSGVSNVAEGGDR